MNAPLLQVNNLGKSFGGVKAVDGISFDLAPGELLALIGPNGAGKSTTFNMVNGQLRADAGSIMLDGADITTLPMYRRAALGLGYLPQETSIFRGMTVEQNINCVLELVEPDKDVREAELDRLLDELRAIDTDCDSMLAQMERVERERTGTGGQGFQEFASLHGRSF